MNRIFLVGRVGGVPDLRRAPGGSAWCTLSVTTRPGVLGRDGGRGTDSEWHEVRLFGAEAESYGRTLRAGALVGIEGTLVYDRWTDEAGVRRRRARVIAHRLQLLTAAPAAHEEDDLPVEDTLDVPSLELDEPTVPR